jgi:hypothetical protein
MLKISESLFDVPIAKNSRPEKVRALTDLILHDFRARKATAKAIENGTSEAVAAPTGKAKNVAE